MIQHLGFRGNELKLFSETYWGYWFSVWSLGFSVGASGMKGAEFRV